MASLKLSRDSLGHSATELLELSWRERWVLLQAFVLLPKLAIWLRLVGFRRLRTFLAWLTPRSGTVLGEHAQGRARDTARLVAAAASHQPLAVSCLPRSLTLWWLLRRQGIETGIRIGVRREGDELQAHAWVELDGEPVNDSPDVHERYAAFDPIQWPKGATWV